MHVYIHIVYVHNCMYIYMSIYIYIHVFIYTLVYIYIYTYTHVCIYIYIHTNIHMFVYIYIFLVCVYLWYLCIYIDIYIYITVHYFKLMLKTAHVLQLPRFPSFFFFRLQCTSGGSKRCMWLAQAAPERVTLEALGGVGPKGTGREGVLRWEYRWEYNGNK